MEKVEIHRVITGPDGTFGVFVFNGIPLCVTCEDPWLDNKTMVSCIPAGTYKVAKYSGTKYKDVWEVKKVPGRAAILIHSGNSINDTNGCILVGTEFGAINGKPAILRSALAMGMLRALLPKEFTLTITGV